MPSHSRQKKKDRQSQVASKSYPSPINGFLGINSTGAVIDSSLPPGFGMNPHAWVLVHRADHHYCNDREKFTTFHEIDPIPVVGSTWLAQGIGSVQLQIRESTDEVSTLSLRNVLFVPKMVVNLIALPMIVTMDYPLAMMDYGTGVLATRHGEEIAQFHYPDGNVPTIKLAHENGGLWPGWMREEQKPPLVLEAYVQGEIVVRKPPEQSISLDGTAMPGFLGAIVNEEDDDVCEEMLDFKVILTVGELLALAPELEYRVMGGRMKQRLLNRRSETIGTAVSTIPRPRGISKISRYQFVKMHWGSYIKFMHSHHLKPTVEGFEDAKSILDTYFQDQISGEAQEMEMEMDREREWEWDRDREWDSEWDREWDREWEWESEQAEEVELLGVHRAKLMFFVGGADIVPIRRDSSISTYLDCEG